MTSGGHNRKPDSLRNRALQFVHDGYTVAYAAKKLGISETAIGRWLREKEGEKPKPQELPEGLRLLHAWPPRSPVEMNQIVSRMPMAEYQAIDALNISRLKQLQRSALHYQHRLHHPLVTAPLTLGTAAHCATLEPERFARQFAVWDRRTESGRMAPRNGKWWDAFQADNADKTILTEDERDEALTIAAAVRADPVAMRYLEAGEPEVTMTWEPGRKGRVDWLTTVGGEPVLVGLKTTRDCRHFAFGAQAAKLGYALQWAWYFDGYMAIKDMAPAVVEIVVESAPPHAVAVYRILDEIIDFGRDEYEVLLDQLAECERAGTWPGPYTEEQVLTLPTWVYGPAADDLASLELEQ